jgi:hypothetical protein
MRESLFKDLGPITVEGLGHPMALEERIFILNQRMKEIHAARTVKIDKRIVAAAKRVAIGGTGTESSGEAVLLSVSN